MAIQSIVFEYDGKRLKAVPGHNSGLWWLLISDGANWTPYRPQPTIVISPRTKIADRVSVICSALRSAAPDPRPAMWAQVFDRPLSKVGR